MSISASMAPYFLHCLEMILTLSKPLTSRIRKHQSHTQKTVDLLHRGGETQLWAIPPLSFLSSAAWLQLRNYISFGRLFPIPLSIKRGCFDLLLWIQIYQFFLVFFQGPRVTENLNRENDMSRLLFPSTMFVLFYTTVRRKHFGKSNTEPGSTNIGWRFTEYSQTQAQDGNTTFLEP